MILQTNYKMKPPPSAKPIKSILKRLGCIGLWLMNEGSGNKVFDLSGNGNTGTHVSSPPWVAGKFGTAVDYDGAADYTTIPDSPSLGLTTQGTIIVWIYGHTRAGSETILTKGNTLTAADIPYALTWDFSDTTKLRLLVGDDTTAQTLITNNAVSLNEWHQFGGTWDNTTLQLYLDGVPDNSVGQTITPYVNAEPLIIGAMRDAPSNLFDGLVSHILIYNRALSASEIAQLYLKPFYMFGRKRNPFIASAAVPPEIASQFASLTTSLWWLKHNKGLYTEL